MWLLLLPIAAWFAWRLGTGRGGRSRWQAVVDRVLQPYVLADGESFGQRRWPVVAAVAAAALAALALAGPTWDRLPVPAYRSDEALVVALDLSNSMDAGDVTPTRLARARLKLLDLLERREGGQTALVVFSAHAFTVTPLTNDTRTIAALVNSLATDIMPSRGSLIESGLEKSASLLRQSGASRGEILLITDAVASPAAFELARELGADGVTVTVLGVGTEEGAPIPNRDGGFLTDSAGRVVVPRLDVGSLRRLAAAGGGRFSRLEADDSDLDRLFPDAAAAGVIADEGDERREADVWRDQGIWFAVALLPLVALGFRRGWVYVLVAGCMLPLPRAEAFEWRDLWQNPDQQGARAFASEEAVQAAELFEDPEWASAAHYRAGQYEASAAALAGIDSPDGHYNRGNALARAGRLAEAIDAYDRTLELDPGHADAEFNRALVAELLEQQQQQQQEQEQQEQEQQAQQQSDDSSQDGEPQSQQGAEPSSGEPEPDGDPADSTGPGQQVADRNDQPPSGDESSEQQARSEPDPEAGQDPRDGERDGEPERGDSPLQAAASPEEIEDWASEQAAEQWLRRVPQDPGGLLRRKFRYQYQQFGVDQDGNRIYPGTAADPW
jgi:Ca-activated chloride channel family protein